MTGRAAVDELCGHTGAVRSGWVELKTIPEDLARFVRECVGRLETLEVLFLLQSSERRWTVQQLKAEMRSSEMSVELGLGILCARGLVVKENDAYLFRPKSPVLEKMTLDLAACYPERRAAVIEAIYSRPRESVRSFADAFRIKKGGDNG